MSSLRHRRESFGANVNTMRASLTALCRMRSIVERTPSSTTLLFNRSFVLFLCVETTLALWTASEMGHSAMRSHCGTLSCRSKLHCVLLRLLKMSVFLQVGGTFCPQLRELFSTKLQETYPVCYPQVIESHPMLTISDLELTEVTRESPRRVNVKRVASLVL